MNHIINLLTTKWSKFKMFLVLTFGDPRKLKGYEKKGIIYQGFMNDRDFRHGYELINPKTNKVFYRRLGDERIIFWENKIKEIK